MTAKAAAKDETIPRGGMWERQVQYGGERLDLRFAPDEAFVLWGIEAGPLVPTDLGEAQKTILLVSTIVKPDERFEVGTLSEPISRMVPEARPEDFPVEAMYKLVPNKREGGGDATVLECLRVWEDPAND